MISIPLLALPLALLPAAPWPAAPVAYQQAAGDLARALDERIARASSAETDELWTWALSLRDVAGLDGEEELDRLLDARLGNAPSPQATLLIAASRVQGEDLDRRALASALQPLLESDDDALAVAAAEILANKTFRSLDRDRRDDLVEALLTVAHDGARTPARRLAAARAAHLLGDGAQMRSARDEMLAFLSSRDAEIRGQGALALASIGDEITGRLEQELRRISLLPGEDGELARAYVKQEERIRLHERKFKNLETLYEGKALDGDLKRISAVRRMIHEYHLDGNKFTDEELTDAALAGMLRVLDNHSSYMDPQTYGKFSQDLEAEYGGIGAYVGEDPVDGLFTITKPIYSGPAYKAGLGTDDKIVRIDDWSTVGEPVDDIIKRLKGKPGTTVRLYVWHRGMDAGLIERPTEELAVEVTRQQIAIPAVQLQVLPGDIALVELTTFSRVASQTLRLALEQLKQAGMKGLVLDLRYNSGGLLDEARDVADLFLPKGKLVVTTESRRQAPEEFHTLHGPAIPTDMPVVVLVNRFTASAAEIVSGALQDHERAEVLGERTYGKGSVQQLMLVDGMRDDLFRDENENRRFDNWETLTRDYDNDGEFDFGPRVKMTVARYVLPSGRSIHREFDADKNILQEGGIEPDQKVEAERIEGWRLEEQRRIFSERLTREYVEERWQEHRALFMELAETDRRDASIYPDFEEFYAGLDTVLPKDDVRSLIRREVRRRVQDEIGREFPFGDFQEDVVVQAGIREILEKLGIDVSEIEAYAATFRPAKEVEDDADTVSVARVERPDVSRALALIQEARDGDGKVSKELLDQVVDLLGELKAPR